MFTLILTIVGPGFASFHNVSGFSRLEAANRAGAAWYNSLQLPVNGYIKEFSVAETNAPVQPPQKWAGGPI